jgi:hypothetical protein
VIFGSSGLKDNARVTAVDYYGVDSYKVGGLSWMGPLHARCYVALDSSNTGAARLVAPGPSYWGNRILCNCFNLTSCQYRKKKYIPSVLSISEANSLMEWNKSLDRTSRQKLQTGRHRLKYSTSPRVGNKLSMTQLKLLSVVIVWSRKECE